MSSAETRSEHMISSLAMLEEPLCDDEYEYYTDEDEADIEDEAECHTLYFDDENALFLLFCG